MKVANIIDGIMIHGRGTLLAKFDVESAYRIIPVYSHDCYLLGIKSQGNYFIDLALPFGLRSAPFMFSSFADLLEWLLKHNYEVQFLLHYLDDFQTLGPPVCQQNLDICVLHFSESGIPLHADKLEGPCMCLTVLGIELDSLTFWARISQEKFDFIAALLDTWSSKQHCTRKELESLVGHLWQHGCKVIPPGRRIYLLFAFWRDDHPIRLNSDFRFNLT